MNLEIFILIIVIHWIADFIFQSEKWAINKSKSNKILLYHCLTYSLIWFFPIFFISDSILGTLAFVEITFVFHYVTDYVTSRIVSRKFKRGDHGSPIPNFGAFSIIGLDQLLHYLQLILTWYILFEIL